MLTSLPLAKHFQGRPGGWGWCVSVKIHQSLYVSAALAQWGLHMGDDGGGVYQGEAVMSGSRFLSCVYLAPQKPPPAVTETITDPLSRLIYASFD